MTRSMLIAAVAALLAGAGGAYAGTSHIVGRDGPTIPLKVNCARAVVPAPGETLDYSVNVIGQQVHCLIRRPDPFARCVRHLGTPPSVVGKFDHGDGKPGDWTGVDKVAAYLGKVAECSKARL